MLCRQYKRKYECNTESPGISITVRMDGESQTLQVLLKPTLNFTFSHYSWKLDPVT